MSDFLPVCVCVQWRDVIVTMTSVGQQQIIHYIARDVTSCNAGSVPVTENYSYTI